MFNKIFNIGLPKTGTSSLYEALKILGFRTMHNHRDFREASFKGEYKYQNDDWRALCNLSEHYYPQLDKAYPGSKFVLTVREVNAWLKSIEKQFGDSRGDERLPILRDHVRWNSLIAMKRVLRRIAGRENKNINMLTRVQIFGTYKFNPERYAFVYHLHYKNALDYFKDRPQDF